MSGWIETYRGWVNAWETDTVAHFTVAYYFDRLADATLLLSEAVGLGRAYREEDRLSAATVDVYVRYLDELRAGDIFHVDSALIGVDEKTARFGHKFINSATGSVCATFEQTLLHFDLDKRKALPFGDALRRDMAARVVDWDGEAREPRYAPDDDTGFSPSHRDFTKPWERDEIGHIGFQFYIHRFSGATMHALATMGLTPAFMRENGYGYSTFEFQLQFRREFKVGEPVEIRSALAHVGNSSVRVLNRMYNLRTGALSAELSQFGVNLDMAKRRPAPFPEAMRLRGQDLMIRAPGS